MRFFLHFRRAYLPCIKHGKLVINAMKFGEHICKRDEMHFLAYHSYSKKISIYSSVKLEQSSTFNFFCAFLESCHKILFLLSSGSRSSSLRWSLTRSTAHKKSSTFTPRNPLFCLLGIPWAHWPSHEVLLHVKLSEHNFNLVFYDLQNILMIDVQAIFGQRRFQIM